MTRRLFKTTLFFMVFLLGLGEVCISSDKEGTTGATFLKIPCGARAIGMGGAFTAVSDDAYAIYWNPAGLAKFVEREATFTYLDYFEGMGFGHVGYVHPNFLLGTFGGAISYLGHGEIEGYDVKDGELIATEYQANSMAIALSYGRSLLEERLSLGGNIKYINERIEDEVATGFAIDLGGLYRIEDFSIGLVIQNLGQEMKFVKEKDPLPLNLRLGFAYRLLNDKLTLVLDGNIPNDNKSYFNLGGEYWILESLAARIGYRGGPKDVGKGICFGIGIKWKEFGLDFSYEPYGKFGGTHHYSFIVKF